MLGPLLFILYTTHVVRMKLPGVQIYADEIGVYASSMQTKLAMKKAEEASQTISDALHVNPKKTDAVLLSFQKGKKRYITKILLDRRTGITGLHTSGTESPGENIAA